MKHDEYRKPVLAIIFQLLGLILVLGAAVLMVITIADETEIEAIEAIPVFVSWFIPGLLFFALGTIIDLLAKNEHNTHELNKKVLHLIRVEHESADSLKTLARGESPEEAEEDDFNFGDLPPA